MKKKLLLLVFPAVVAAIAALPAAASATPWHTSSTGAFTLTSGTTVWGTSAGMTVHCNKVTGSGNYTTTTGGTLDLAIGTCFLNTEFGVLHCTTLGQAKGTILTTTLRFDNVMLEGKPGVLLTPNAETGAVAHFGCGGVIVGFTFQGNGMLGTVTAPICGGSSSTATWKFRSIAHGVQEHTLYTGTTYSWKFNEQNMAFDTEATVNLPVAKTVTCT
jgi:hypothetical protein